MRGAGNECIVVELGYEYRPVGRNHSIHFIDEESLMDILLAAANRILCRRFSSLYIGGIPKMVLLNDILLLGKEITPYTLCVVMMFFCRKISVVEIICSITSSL